MGELGKRNVWGSLAVVSCALALAACGSSPKPGSATGSRPHSRALEFANCMRAHGVPSFPDPSGQGGGINLDGSGINAQSPAFESAQRACARLAPGHVGGVQATESQFLAAVRFAKCMRVHGFSDFPDPTHSDSPPGPILIVRAGLFFRVSPSFNPNTPAANRAMAACGGGTGH